MEPRFMELIKEFYGRMGMDFRFGKPFMHPLTELNEEICSHISKILGISIGEIHNLTSNIKKFDDMGERVKSIMGDNYLTGKVIKIKLKVTIEECELIDDVNVAKQKKRQKRDYKIGNKKECDKWTR